MTPRPNRSRSALVVVAIVALFPSFARADPGLDAVPVDPLDSPAWVTMARGFLSEHPIRFDDRVRVRAPDAAEDPMGVPVHVSAEGIEDVIEVLVIADLNPIPKILSYRPIQAEPTLGFRFKVEQSTPIRAAVLTREGWHVGGRWLSASGGGCTAPSMTSQGEQWTDQLGNLAARTWQRGKIARVKVKVMHPMDTGLAAGIPVFYLETLRFEDGRGRLLAELSPFMPVSENPVFTLDLESDGPVRITGRDNQANLVAGLLVNGGGK